MNIKKLVVGELSTNCYVLELDDQCIIIDPGADFNIIKNNINKKVQAVIITHHHFDHIGAVNDIINNYHCKVFDKSNLKEGQNRIEKFFFNVIYTPGHKEDSICLYFVNEFAMFVGDFIFKDGIGRMDLEGGNASDMKKSIKNILNYPLNTKIYPGHGPSTTIGEEKENLLYYEYNLE